MRNKLLLLLMSVLLCTIGSLIPVHAAELPFTDISANAWYYNDVETAVETGLVNGKTETTYAPDEFLTYAQAVKLAACMNQKYNSGSVTLQNGNPWYQSYVDYAKANAIISQDFDWNANITRAGYMGIFAHALPDSALAAVNDISDGSIPDVSMSHRQAAEIYKLYRAGILQGSDEQHSCKPDDNIKRCEVAAILTRMMTASARIRFTMAKDSKPSMPTEPFNRLTIRYSAPTPSKVTVSYDESAGAVTDVFYLEAGDNAVFSGLIQSYLKDKTANNLKIVSAESLTKGAAPVIRSVTGEKIPLYAKEIYYLENDRYKVGINLNWGGGVSEIYDKKNTIPGLSNLINKHDTGRSIQQSYYGVVESGNYKGDVLDGVQWPYNPVQGGDWYNKPSRLIDIVVKTDSVWVKAQPADWSKNNSLTPSYMENTYSFVGNCLRVDNRHMDFSGLLPAEIYGEIPAIYTVNWLDDVVWYSGDKSWTGDTLSWDKIMEYGSDGICWKRMQIGQTETWCALMKKSADYGLGIYVPGADVFSPMGDLIGETKDPMVHESSYLGAVENIQLGSFEAIEYSYLLATGSANAIRSAFRENKDLIKNEMLERSNLYRNYITNYTSLDFTTPQSAEAFREPRFDAVAEFDKDVGTVRLTATTGFDPYLMLVYDNSTVKLSADKYKKARLTYMIPTTNGRQSYWGELFLCSGKWTETEAGISKQISEMKADGKWHAVEIDLTADFWSGDIHGIRLDFFNECEAGDVMYVQKIELVP